MERRGDARASIAHSSLHLGVYLCRVNGLGEQFELMTSGARRLKEVLGRCLPGKEQHLAGRQHFAHLNRGFHSRHPRYDDVGDQQIRVKVSCHLDCRLAAVCCTRRHSGPNPRIGVIYGSVRIKRSSSNHLSLLGRFPLRRPPSGLSQRVRYQHGPALP